MGKASWSCKTSAAWRGGLLVVLARWFSDCTRRATFKLQQTLLAMHGVRLLQGLLDEVGQRRTLQFALVSLNSKDTRIVDVCEKRRRCVWTTATESSRSCWRIAGKQVGAEVLEGARETRLWGSHQISHGKPVLLVKALVLPDGGTEGVFSTESWRRCGINLDAWRNCDDRRVWSWRQIPGVCDGRRS